ncbi:hypothetical protein HaLaN_21576 [Haematococcus lacustris]|uniref:Uncharacterized protein n=1 Tax=Haematococcus lacustris TaxID=44745 RepID=A0A699ZYT2_HAELA|nr:hypothetical protein HaLaN_21576 [Haematococcus lacustris]
MPHLLFSFPQAGLRPGCSLPPFMYSGPGVPPLTLMGGQAGACGAVLGVPAMQLPQIMQPGPVGTEPSPVQPCLLMQPETSVVGPSDLLSDGGGEGASGQQDRLVGGGSQGEQCDPLPSGAGVQTQGTAMDSDAQCCARNGAPLHPQLLALAIAAGLCEERGEA